MEPSELLVHATSSIPDRRYEDLTFEQLASAHSAFTSAAVRIQCDARSLDRDRSAWLKAIKDDGLVWPNHVSDLNGWTSSGGATYGITSIPATVLIDKEGRVIARNLRGDELENKLKQIFGK